MDTSINGRRAWLGLLGRHQLASLLSTVLDFGAMALLVQLAFVPPSIAAVAGASLGALVNFQLGRHYTFRARGSPAGPQALRYAQVSAVGALLNGGGELALHDGLGAPYLPARLVVALAVSLAWNLPMQRHFVFRTARKAES